MKERDNSMYYWYVFEDGYAMCVKGCSRLELKHEIKKHGKLLNKHKA
jgi:hypothetical protein